MAFEKGKPKTGGRKSGTPNKTTTDIKALIVAFVSENFETVTNDIKELEPKDRVNAFLKFLEYTVAKQRETKIDVSNLTEEQLDALLQRAKDMYNEHEDSDLSDEE